MRAEYTKPLLPLTERQREVLVFIADAIASGRPPTLREIGERFLIQSTNGVNDHLRALVRKGHLDRCRMKSRSMWLTVKGKKEIGVLPVVDPTPCPRCGR